MQFHIPLLATRGVPHLFYDGVSKSMRWLTTQEAIPSHLAITPAL